MNRYSIGFEYTFKILNTALDLFIFFYCVKPNIKFIEIIHMNLDITQANAYNIKVWAYVINIRHNSLIYGNLEFL